MEATRGPATRPRPSANWFSSRTALCLKEIPVKKIALTLIAVSALGVAACSGSNTANNAANEVSETTNEAVEDTRGATNDMRNAVVDGQNQVGETIEAGSNVANATGAAIANETGR
jgi:hypothetical protein